MFLLKKVLTFVVTILCTTGVLLADPNYSITRKGMWEVTCGSELISEHATYYKALESSINQLKDCVITPPLRFEVKYSGGASNPQTVVTLSWDIPTEREDGTLLPPDEISGYEIAYGIDANNLTSKVSVLGASTLNTVIEGLPDDTYFFAIATLDSDNLLGNYSETITVIINSRS